MSNPMPDAQRMVTAIRKLYYAGHWTCDREVNDAAEMWSELRDAAGLEPGNSPIPIAKVGGRITMTNRCPTCDSPDPKLHPAMQYGGEVQPCKNQYHTSTGTQVTSEPIYHTSSGTVINPPEPVIPLTFDDSATVKLLRSQLALAQQEIERLTRERDEWIETAQGQGESKNNAIRAYNDLESRNRELREQIEQLTKERDELADRHWIAGAKCGFSLGLENNSAGLSQSIEARRRELVAVAQEDK